MVQYKMLSEILTTQATQFLVNHLPFDRVEEIVRLVVWRLKEAGEVVLCPCETLWIWLILEQGNICCEMETREKEKSEKEGQVCILNSTKKTYSLCRVNTNSSIYLNISNI